MRYACLIYNREDQWDQMSEAEQQKVMDDYFAYSASLNEAKANLGGEALLPTSSATTVRVRNGETVTTDGPFAETKEQLGGFYLIEAENLDEAIQWAARIPDAQSGSVEVRPIMEFE